MRRLFYSSVSALAVALASTGCRGGKELEKVDIYTQYHGVTFVDKFKVWATGPDEVVARDAFYEPDNYIYDGSTVYLTALRGESAWRWAHCSAPRKPEFPKAPSPSISNIT